MSIIMMAMVTGDGSQLTSMKIRNSSTICKSHSLRTTGTSMSSPLAKKIAIDKGYNLADIKGSGENGRIIKKDVENYTPVEKVVEPVLTTSSNAQSFVNTGVEQSDEVKNSQMRKAIAKSLGNSKFSAPDFSLNIEVIFYGRLLVI